MSRALCTRHCCRARTACCWRVGQHVPRPVNLEGLRPGRGSGWRSGSTTSRARSTMYKAAGIASPVLMHRKIGVGGFDQGVVLR